MPTERASTSEQSSVPAHTAVTPEPDIILASDNGRRSTWDSQIVRNMVLVADFEVLHLSEPPTGLGVKQFQTSNDTKIIDDIKATRSEFRMYPKVVRLLNNISKRVYSALSKDSANTMTSSGWIIFVDHHSYYPRHHPHNAVQVKPDLLAVSTSDGYTESKRKDNSVRIPYTHVRSAIEVKPSVDGIKQAVTYAHTLMEARPDMPGVYGLSLNNNGYQVLWSDASGAVCSPFTPWSQDKNRLLVAYITSLYNPPKPHILFDRTITIDDPEETHPIAESSGNEEFEEEADMEDDSEEGQAGDEPHAHQESTAPDECLMLPRWKIICANVIYTACVQIFVGHIWGRRTNVFSSPRHQVVIKDYFPDGDRRFKEADLIDKIHAKGTVPGVVRMIVAEEVQVMDSIEHTDSAEHTDSEQSEPVKVTTALPVRDGSAPRTRTRLVLGSTGVKLDKAKSVKDLLMAVYDAVEVHRMIANRRDVLHRDMSINNILMYPKHKSTSPEKEKPRAMATDSPMLITEILSKATQSDSPLGQAEKKARCLIIDFDNAADLREEAETGELFNRTGTPAFIARAVASGQWKTSVAYIRSFKPMPELKEYAKEVYDRCYGEEMYNKYSDANKPVGYTHGGQEIPDEEEPAMKFRHRLLHDVESIYWVLLFVLIHAQPLHGEREDNPPETFLQAVKFFDDHVIVKGSADDSRDLMLIWVLSRFRLALHPGLSSLAPLLAKLTTQVAPEYALLKPSPPPDHLHEAFRRILLDFILKMEDDIPLDDKQGRNTVSKPKKGVKRGTGGEEGREGGSKRKKTHESRASQHLRESEKLTGHRYYHDPKN